ncbi:MAG: prephenate dehydratase [Chloroflexota bacterium]
MSQTNPIVVAFQGEAGAYSEQAVRQHFGPDVQTLPCRTFNDAFHALQEHRATHGMLPVENTLAGTVTPVYDLLVDHDMYIQSEVIVKVEHCLMAPPGTQLEDIKYVKSHYQALGQCEQTLRRMKLEPITHYDTAGAARDLAEHPEPHTAAIASALAAQTYNLEILVHHLEDLDFNYTRFFVLDPTPPPRKDPSKTSIIFTTRHVPGALFDVMAELAKEKVNMSKIESRPRRNRPWHYLFYVDIEGHQDDPNIQRALLGILKRAAFLKVIGSYPAAELPSAHR